MYLIYNTVCIYNSNHFRCVDNLAFDLVIWSVPPQTILNSGNLIDPTLDLLNLILHNI